MCRSCRCHCRCRHFFSFFWLFFPFLSFLFSSFSFPPLCLCSLHTSILLFAISMHTRYCTFYWHIVTVQSSPLDRHSLNERILWRRMYGKCDWHMRKTWMIADSNGFLTSRTNPNRKHQILLRFAVVKLMTHQTEFLAIVSLSGSVVRQTNKIIDKSRFSLDELCVNKYWWVRFEKGNVSECNRYLFRMVSIE